MDTDENSKKAGREGTAVGQTVAFLITWFLSITAILIGVHEQIRRYGNNRTALISILAAFALLFALYWLPGFPAIRSRLDSRLNRTGRVCLGGSFLIIPYLVYGWGTETLTAVSLLKLVAVAAVPLGIYALIPPGSEKLSWQDVTALCVIAAPVYCGWYREIWSVPVYLDAMARLFVVSLAAFAFLSVRSLEGTGYIWRLQAGDWLEGAKQLAMFALIGIPLGFILRFIAWHPRSEGIAAVTFSFIGIFLFIAVAEELFFRGILQNLLEKSITNKYLARAIAAAVFGISHIQHGFPNWRYVLMAAVAGWFYGTAWHKRRSIVASSITHAAVDALWRQFLLS